MLILTIIFIASENVGNILRAEDRTGTRVSQLFSLRKKNKHSILWIERKKVLKMWAET